jgi:hypothetical protein
MRLLTAQGCGGDRLVRCRAEPIHMFFIIEKIWRASGAAGAETAHP